VVARGTTLSEEMLRAYHTRFDGSVEPMFDEFAY
jgi:glutamate--cysteine ligase